MSSDDTLYRTPQNKIEHKAGIMLSGLVTVAILVWLLWRSRFGIDFSDEGFYLAWISNPWLYNVSAIEFGFIYHAFYKLLEGNIAQLRQFNILLTFFLTWWLCHNFFQEINPINREDNKWGKVVNLTLAAALAIGSFTLFKLWLITPSYNSLAFQALLLAGSGMLLAEQRASKSSILGWGLIGVAGWLAFMSKPTTAAVLALLTIVYSLFISKLRFRLVIISVVVAALLLLLTAWVLDGSILGFINRFKMGAEATQILSDDYRLSNLLRWDEFNLTTTEELLLTAFGFFVFITMCLLSIKNRALKLIGYGLTFLPMLACLTIIANIYNPAISPSNFFPLIALGISAGVITASIVLARARLFTSVSRKQWALAICFLAFPYAYAFGSDNNYWGQESIVVIFWILSSMVLLSSVATTLPSRRALLLPIVAVTQLIVVLVINMAMENPYRQPQPLAQNHSITVVGSKDNTLILSSSFAHYFDTLKETAAMVNFLPNTPMIDMTGQSPTSLFAIGARAIGAAWILGGYPGSDRYAINVLSRVPCNEIAEAWLLVEPDGPRKVSSTVLRYFGANIDRDYIVVGEVTTPSGAGGYDKPRQQLLLKPLRSFQDATFACEQSKNKAL